LDSKQNFIEILDLKGKFSETQLDLG